ncbi:chromosome segregation protein SMC [Candidatus Woesearchaeota archaeon]|nr:chromosome segregation protein SMC [Candidatus Woesearchaeota archaeon]
MTKINKLIMHGFKSFARRTELVFGDDFNCVLGPNGSGKSNILDALCFVLGRLSAKSMRVHKASNLIYNGGKTKKAMKQAEVSIFFDNESKTFPTEDPYVKITRMIKQSGQSVYKINDKKRTRQQILDLMSVAKIDPEGYNIVLQGDIVRFTEMRPEDRRILIEDISGISVYEEKKQKAIRELEKVDEKLKEAGVILAERKRYLKELKKDRDQALKFKELESKVKENKASLIFRQIKKTEERKSKLDEKISKHQSILDELNKRINEFKRQIEEKKQKISELNKEIEEKGEKGQVKLQKETEELKVSIATNKTRIETLRGEIDKIELRKKTLKKDLQSIDTEIEHLNSEKQELEKKKSSVTKELEEINDKINRFKQDNELENVSEIESQIEEAEKKIENQQQSLEQLRAQQQDMLRKKDSLEFQLNSIDEKINKVLQIEKENKDQIDSLKNKKQEFKDSVLELNKRLNEDSSLSQQISSKKQKLSNAHEEFAKLQAKEAAIRESVLGDIAVKKILEQKNSIKGIYGTVAELGDVEKRYSLALEVAAGPRLKSIVVEDDKTAAKCIKFLKEKKLGTATFLPLNKIKSRKIFPEVKKLKEKENVHDFAVNLVSFEDKFKKIFSYVFGHTLVVGDIDTARKIGIGKTRMVTLDGDLAETSGAMQGGFRQKKRYSFNQKELNRDIKEYEELISKLKDTISTLENRRSENEEMISKLRERKANLEGDIIKQEKSLHLESGDIDSDKNLKKELQEKIEQKDKELNDIELKINEKIKSLTEIKTKKQQLRSRISDIRDSEIAAELNAYKDKITELKEQVMNYEADIRSINTQINDMKKPEKEKIRSILSQQSKDSENFNQEIEKLVEKNEQETATLKEQEKRSQEFYLKFKQLFNQRDKLNDGIQEQESKIEEIREKSKDVEIEMNNISLKNAEIKAKLSGLQEDFKQYEGVKINKEKPEEQLKQEIDKFEKIVSEIGNVNMRSLEVYEEIEKEYQSLLNKKEKLSLEKQDVIEMMDEIEGKKKDLFMKTFNVLEENFKKIFSAITAKDREASLVLENTENPFEGGLDIKVKITGKKTLDIRSLSGGEKTLTALAFIFAIQEHEPHSFYVLDEVDAALDKHNSEKLSKLIRDYVKKAQYLIISHNDAMISEADNLYGVSMNEHGITNVTSLKV